MVEVNLIKVLDSKSDKGNYIYYIGFYNDALFLFSFIFCMFYILVSGSAVVIHFKRHSNKVIDRKILGKNMKLKISHGFISQKYGEEIEQNKRNIWVLCSFILSLFL